MAVFATICTGSSLHNNISTSKMTAENEVANYLKHVDICASRAAYSVYKIQYVT